MHILHVRHDVAIDYRCSGSIRSAASDTATLLNRLDRQQTKHSKLGEGTGYMATTAEELRHLIDQLEPNEQERLLTYARELSRTAERPYPHTSLPRDTSLPRGTPGRMIADLRVSPEGW